MSPSLRTPFGLGQTKPRHYLEMARVAWRNRDEAGYAWRILRDGVCDGCALGTSGLRDWTLDGVHLCMVRLDLLRLNTMPALDPALLADAGDLAARGSTALRGLGRLAHPMLRRAGEPGFRRVSWPEAIDIAATGLARVREHDPTRAAFFLTSRGIPNETYYVAQKAARFFGTPHIDTAARLCHAASTIALKRAYGYGAATNSYTDWLDADLIVFFGSNVPNNQPVTIKYLHHAVRRGAEIAVVNPYREPGLERYWVPSVPSSAVFGTDLARHWFAVDTGGDLAFLNGTMKALLDLPGGVARDFVERSTEDFAALEAALRQTSWQELECASGTSRAEMERFAALLRSRPKTILVWSMGLTQHRHGVDTVLAICNLGLMRGLPGLPGAGLVPIRGHSGVQGGSEVGCAPESETGILDHWAEVWGFEPPRGPGLAATGQIEAAADGDIDAFWIMGGNFLETTPDRELVERALHRPELRVHQDVVLNSAMLVEPSDTVLLLPTTTRYEIPGGVTETTTERRIVFSPSIRHDGAESRTLGECRPEWEVLCEIISRVRPEPAGALDFADTAEVRAEIARIEPRYAGIENLERKGDQFQWGGPHLFEDGRFATPSGRARFHAVEPPADRPTGTGRPFAPGSRSRRSEVRFGRSRPGPPPCPRSRALRPADERGGWADARHRRRPASRRLVAGVTDRVRCPIRADQGRQRRSALARVHGAVALVPGPRLRRTGVRCPGTGRTNGSPGVKPAATETSAGRSALVERSGDLGRDLVAVEEPLEIRVDGDAVVVTMRSPGAERDLALGYLYAEGLIEQMADVENVTVGGAPRLDETLPTDDEPTVPGTIVDVRLSASGRRAASRRGETRKREQAFRVTSACGVCGKPSLEDLWVRLPAIRPLDLDPDCERLLVQKLPAAMQKGQPLFSDTGGVHAAALFEVARGEPELLWLREDIGRHNAVDKVTGKALRANRLPLDDTVLAVSGRLGFEIVQKAAVAGIPVLAAVGAPSSLALDIAHLAGIRVYAFVAADRSNLYPAAPVEARRLGGSD